MSTGVLWRNPRWDAASYPVARWAALAAVGILVCGIVFLLLRGRAERWSDLKAFWAPFMEARAPVAIYVEDGRAYVPAFPDPEPESHDATPARFGTRKDARAPATPLLPLPRRYVRMAELECLVQLTSWLTRWSRPYSIVVSSRTNYPGLLDVPVIMLVRGDDPRFAATLRGVRFSVREHASSGANIVHDRLNAPIASLRLSGNSRASNADDDYAVITLVRSGNKAPLLIASSATGLGSGAVGRFLTAAGPFARASVLLPGDWRTRNVQVVLRIPIVHGSAGRAEVVATHAW